jgi:hypothetical protein
MPLSLPFSFSNKSFKGKDVEITNNSKDLINKTKRSNKDKDKDKDKDNNKDNSLPGKPYFL